MAKVYMAIDQFNQTYHGLTHPRKELCELLGNSHAEKMYVDCKDGKSYHNGYVIGDRWLTLYEVKRFRKLVD